MSNKNVDIKPFWYKKREWRILTTEPYSPGIKTLTHNEFKQYNNFTWRPNHKFKVWDLFSNRKLIVEYKTQEIVQQDEDKFCIKGFI